MNRTTLNCDYQLRVVKPQVAETGPIYRINVTINSRCIRWMLGGGTINVEDKIYTDSINLNLFSDEEQIRAHVQNLLSGIDIDVLDEECVEWLTRRIPVDTAGELPGPETPDVSVIFEVEISVEFMVRMVAVDEEEQAADFEADFDTDEDSYNGIIKNPASDFEISKLKRFKYGGETGEASACIICIEGLPGEEVISLACEHVFHSDCIVRWLKENNSCPAGQLDTSRTVKNHLIRFPVWIR